MRDLDDLPKRHEHHALEDEAVRAFMASLDPSAWIVHESRRDYGVDLRLEIVEHGRATNLHVWAQLKGTDNPANADGSVSIAHIATTNLNYLLSQPHAMYVCYHRPSGRLLHRSADDVHRRHARDATKSLTVHFYEAFDVSAIARLRAHTSAAGRARRDERLRWDAEPEQAAALVRRGRVVQVSSDPVRARKQLEDLSADGLDGAISEAFEQFEAVLPAFPDMIPAHLAEINLGMNDPSAAHPDRIRTARELLQHKLAAGRLEPGTAQYSIANAHLALGEHEEAVASFHRAADLLSSRPGVLAQCHKNRGAALAGMGDEAGAVDAYAAALSLDPDLAEAHLALALLLRSQGRLEASLRHLDAIRPRRGSALTSTAIMGWRGELLLRLGRVGEAFRDIHALVGSPDAPGWAWSWCARIVTENAGTSVEASEAAVRFWRAYLEVHPGSLFAEEQRHRSAYRAKMGGGTPSMTLAQFAEGVAMLSAAADEGAGSFWDRLGHWAQHDGDWAAAERAFRRALDHDDAYACCLAVVLNRDGRHAEAAHLLDAFLERHPADVPGHFQRGVAASRSKDHARAEVAHRRVLELDPDHALARFSLGGALWNQGRRAEGVAIWRDAINRHPDHEEAAVLHRDLPGLFGGSSWR